MLVPTWVPKLVPEFIEVGIGGLATPPISPVEKLNPSDLGAALWDGQSSSRPSPALGLFAFGGGFNAGTAFGVLLDGLVWKRLSKAAEGGRPFVTTTGTGGVLGDWGSNPVGAWHSNQTLSNNF